LTNRIFFVYCTHCNLEKTVSLIGKLVSPLEKVRGYIANDNPMDRVHEVQGKVAWF